MQKQWHSAKTHCLPSAKDPALGSHHICRVSFSLTLGKASVNGRFAGVFTLFCQGHFGTQQSFLLFLSSLSIIYGQALVTGFLLFISSLSIISSGSLLKKRFSEAGKKH